MKTSSSKFALHVVTLISLIISLMGSALFFIQARAATLTVSDCSAPSGASGRLVNQITAAASGDTVNFSCNGTITLASTITIPTKSLTIDGSGHNVTISGGDLVQVINDSAAALTLKNLTIAHGGCTDCEGGGLYFADGTLTIKDSTFSSNQVTHSSGSAFGGGIFQGGGTLDITGSIFSGNASVKGGGGGIYAYNSTVTITDSTFSSNSDNGNGGGGIYFNSSPLLMLTITHSIFSNNVGASGGGVLNLSGNTSVTNSTFSGNYMPGGGGPSGGGIFQNDGTLTISGSTFSGNQANGTQSNYGGGIYTGADPTTITNSTFSGNSASTGGGAIFNHDSALIIQNSTISGNSASGTYGGGIYIEDSTTVTLKNTIDANNLNGNCSGFGGYSIINGGNNIEDGTTCLWGSANGSMSSTNPKLGPLAGNGGFTQTFALLAGSPAIDGVTWNLPNGAPSTDQRGIWRPIGLRYDIGAYEKGWMVFLPLILR